LVIKKKTVKQNRKGQGGEMQRESTYEIANYDDWMELLLYKDRLLMLKPSIRRAIKKWAEGNTNESKFYHLFNPTKNKEKKEIWEIAKEIYELEMIPEPEQEEEPEPVPEPEREPKSQKQIMEDLEEQETKAAEKEKYKAQKRKEKAEKQNKARKK
jgi:hypothetical protein